MRRYLQKIHERENELKFDYQVSPCWSEAKSNMSTVHVVKASIWRWKLWSNSYSTLVLCRPSRTNNKCWTRSTSSLMMILKAMMTDFTKSCIIIRSLSSILHDRSNNCIALLHNALSGYFTQTSQLLKCNSHWCNASISTQGNALSVHHIAWTKYNPTEEKNHPKKHLSENICYTYF